MEELEDEVWKVIEGVAGFYQVSSHGNVRSEKKILKPGIIKGFLQVGLPSFEIYYDRKYHRRKRSVNRLIHHLVAQYFVEKPADQDYYYVAHIDRDKQNNYYKNLKW